MKHQSDFSWSFSSGLPSSDSRINVSVDDIDSSFPKEWPHFGPFERVDWFCGYRFIEKMVAGSGGRRSSAARGQHRRGVQQPRRHLRGDQSARLGQLPGRPVGGLGRAGPPLAARRVSTGRAVPAGHQGLTSSYRFFCITTSILGFYV